MGTFFEKLTGAGQETAHPAASSTTPSSNPVARPAKKTVTLPREEPKSTRLKVATEEAEDQGEKKALPEEEGELTVDIYDQGDAIVIQSTVAGVKPEDLDVSITNDSVTIRGKRERQETIEEKSYYYKELFWGTFSRSVILPEEIDEDLAEATLKYGLLSIRLPKKRRGVAQKLKIKVT